MEILHLLKIMSFNVRLSETSNFYFHYNLSIKTKENLLCLTFVTYEPQKNLLSLSFENIMNAFVLSYGHCTIVRFQFFIV